MLRSKALGAFGDEHHVRAFFENRARQADGIPDAVKAGHGASTKSRGVHHDGIAFDLSIQVEVRTVTGVEDRIVFESHDGGFDGVERVAAAREHSPTGLERAPAPDLAGFDGVIGNIPGATMNNKRRRHKK
jgi:hypothetical protein